MKSISELHNTQLNSLKELLKKEIAKGVTIQGEFITYENKPEQFACIKFDGISGFSQTVYSELIPVEKLNDTSFCIKQIKKDIERKAFIKGAVFTE